MLHDMHEMGVNFDEKYYRRWLFEYACQTLEWQGIKPSDAPNMIRFHNYRKAGIIYMGCCNCYAQADYEGLDITDEINMKDIPDIVWREQKGNPVWMYDKKGDEKNV